MEIQCKERVDLLEALRLSRVDASASGAATEGGSSASGGSSNNASSNTGGTKLSKSYPNNHNRVSSESEISVQGFIGDGTIPALDYQNLRKSDLPTSRPYAPRRNTSERAVVGRHLSSGSMTSNHMDIALKAARNPGIGLDPSTTTLLPPLLPPRKPSGLGGGSSAAVGGALRKKTSRSPSPHKERTMLTTLRFGRGEKRPAKPASRGSGSSTIKGEESVGGKAATLAWNALKKNKPANNPPLEIAASSAALESSSKTSVPLSERNSQENGIYYDSSTRRLVNMKSNSSTDVHGRGDSSKPRPASYPFPSSDTLRPYSENTQEAPGPSLTRRSAEEEVRQDGDAGLSTPQSEPDTSVSSTNKLRRKPVAQNSTPGHFEPATYPTYMREYPDTNSRRAPVERQSVLPLKGYSPSRRERDDRVKVSYGRSAVANSSSARRSSFEERNALGRRAARGAAHARVKGDADESSTSYEEPRRRPKRRVPKQKAEEDKILVDVSPRESEKEDEDEDEDTKSHNAWRRKVKETLKHLPPGCDESAAKAILNDIVVQGDEVHWSDVAGLQAAKDALKEAVVYPFLRPDLFMGLREPARGMLLFGPPGTGKTMLARAVATESKSTFFSISASSLTSKYLGESEKLVKALFLLAKKLAPSIIFVDEIDSLLSSRSGSGEHEATRRIKTEFLIQWSDLQRAAAGREQSEKEKERGDASRVLVLAATNMPWAIDDAARRRFVRRQYIPLPEAETRKVQLEHLLGHQNHSVSADELDKLVEITDGKSCPPSNLSPNPVYLISLLIIHLPFGPTLTHPLGFSGSDITALAKDAAMGPLRSLGEALLHMTMEDIRPIGLGDFEASLVNIRPSVSQNGLREYEEWAREFGERGG